MYQHQGWWFPSYENHFPRLLDKAVKQGHGPEYQKPVRDLAVSFCQRRLRALDIGANVGLWSRDLCKTFSQVLAFEPVGDFQNCLIQNVTDDNLQLYRCALGNVDSTVDMNICQGNTGHSHIDQNSIGQGSIPIRKLDSLGLEEFDFCKIDCEGYEKEILLGGQNTILKYKPVLVLEQKLQKDTGIFKHNQMQAVELVQSWGAKILGSVRDDYILGW